MKEITDERDEDNYDEAGSQKEDEDIDDKTDGRPAIYLQPRKMSNVNMINAMTLFEMLTS